jgi:hypothetical protein
MPGICRAYTQGMNANTKMVGRFSLDPSTGTLEGPAEYLKERGDALVKAILDGTDAVFTATARYSPDVVTAILVRLQTDYAAWAGDAVVRGRGALNGNHRGRDPRNRRRLHAAAPGRLARPPG